MRKTCNSGVFITNLQEIVATSGSDNVAFYLKVRERVAENVTERSIDYPGTVTVVGVTVREVGALDNTRASVQHLILTIYKKDHYFEDQVKTLDFRLPLDYPSPLQTKATSKIHITTTSNS